MDRIDIMTEIQTTIENSGSVTRQDIDKFSEQPICIGETDGLWWYVVTVNERFAYLEAYAEGEGGSLDFDVVRETTLLGFNSIGTFELELILKVLKAKYEPARKPTKKLNHNQLASKIVSLNLGEEINFSANEDGSDYWGAKCVDVFDSSVTLVGCYGKSPEFILWDDECSHRRVLDFMSYSFKQEFLYTFDE